MGVSLCWLLDVVLFTPAFPAQAVYWLSDLRSNRPWTKQGNNHQGNNQPLSFSSYAPCPVTSPLLSCSWISSPALIFYMLCFFGPVVSFTVLAFPGEKNKPRLYFCVWFTAFAEFIFTSWGEKYECLLSHWPLTCPAGWKGFLTHPSHASALQSAGGAGRGHRWRLRRLGI